MLQFYYLIPDGNPPTTTVTGGPAHAFWICTALAMFFGFVIIIRNVAVWSWRMAKRAWTAWKRFRS